MSNFRKLVQNALVAFGLLSQGNTATAEPQSAVTPETDITAIHSVDSGTSRQQKRQLNGKVSADALPEPPTAAKPLKASVMKSETAEQLQPQQAKAQDTNQVANVNESQLSIQTAITDKSNERNGDNNQHGLNEVGGVNEPNGDNNQSGSNN
jgi:hypothetical protein